MATNHCIIPTVIGITAYSIKDFQMVSITSETPNGINYLNKYLYNLQIIIYMIYIII